MKKYGASAKTKSQIREEIFLVRKRLVCIGPSNVRGGMILDFAQLVPCLNEEARPLYEYDASANTKSQVADEFSIVGKKLVCRGPSNKLRVPLRRGIREDFNPNIIRY